MPATTKALPAADRYIAAERNVSTGYPIPQQDWYDGEVGDMCTWENHETWQVQVTLRLEWSDKANQCL